MGYLPDFLFFIILLFIFYYRRVDVLRENHKHIQVRIRLLLALISSHGTWVLICYMGYLI